MSVKFITLGETLVSSNTGLDAIKRAPIVDYPTPIRCLRIQDVSQSKAFEDWGYTEVESKNYEKFQLKAGDIIVARTGNTVGVNQFIKRDVSAVFNNGLIRLRVDTQRFDSKFIYFNFRTSSYQGFIENISGGTSTQPNMQINALLTMEIPSFPLPEQNAIASVLSSLDDKIDLLHRQNKTLEAMAETLFRQWFIEEAKEDWEEKTIGDIFTIKGGGTPSTKEPSYWDGSIAWTSPRDLSTAKSLYMFSTERTITELGLTKVSSGLLPVGTLLMSSRAPIGYLALTDIEVAVNQGYIAILKHDLYSNEFMYLWCKANMELIKNSGNGSVFQEISKASFRELPFVCPPEPLLKRFNGYCINWFSKIKLNAKQIQTLENLRDTLLPRLMSGEVRVQYQTEDVA